MLNVSKITKTKNACSKLAQLSSRPNEDIYYIMKYDKNVKQL